MGPTEETQCVQEIRHLNRIIRWAEDSIEYEADQRHADLIVEQLGLKDAKPLSSPGTAEITFTEEDCKGEK